MASLTKYVLTYLFFAAIVIDLSVAAFFQTVCEPVVPLHTNPFWARNLQSSFSEISVGVGLLLIRCSSFSFFVISLHYGSAYDTTFLFLMAHLGLPSLFYFLKLIF